MNNNIRRRAKLCGLLIVILTLFALTAFQSSAAMSESEMKNRLSSYSSWFSAPEKNRFTIVCPAKNVSDDKVFTYINSITSLLRGDLVDDYCEININFRYSESMFSSFDAFTQSAFTLEDKLKVYWTNWSETNQLDVVCSRTGSPATGAIYTTKIMLSLNGSDPDDDIPEYDAKIKQLVENAKKASSNKMEIVQYLCRWLDTNVTYSLFYQYTNSPYVAVMKGKGVCGSYANALKDMCELAGIPAIVPVNQDELNHAWNEVYVDGKWYTVDLCYVIEPADNKYNGYCFANPDRKRFPVDHFSFIERHKAEYVATFDYYNAVNINDCTFSAIADQSYTGSAICPPFTVKYGSTTLKKGTHFTVSYSSNTNVGLGKITITGIPSAGYKGTKTLTFSIIPTNPTKFTAVSGKTSVKISWSAVPGATGYRVYIYNPQTKKYSIALTATSSTSYTAKNLTPGTKYLFAVKAYSIADSKIKWANSFTTFLTATKPDCATLKASQTLSSVTLSWNKVSGATGYRVFMYNSATKKWRALATTAKTSYVLSSLPAGTKYTLAVRAYVKAGATAYWSDYTPFVASTIPSTPTATLSSAAPGKVTVKWTSAGAVTGYQIYYSRNKTSGYKKLTNSVGNAGTYSFVSGATYYIRVRAYTKTTSGYVYGAFSAVKAVNVK